MLIKTQDCVFTLSQMTDFTIFQTERILRQKFQIWWNRLKSLQTGRKHCGEKELEELDTCIAPQAFFFCNDEKKFLTSI